MCTVHRVVLFIVHEQYPGWLRGLQTVRLLYIEYFSFRIARRCGITEPSENYFEVQATNDLAFSLELPDVVE